MLQDFKIWALLSTALVFLSSSAPKHSYWSTRNMASVIIFLLLMMSLTVFLSYFPFFLSSRLLHFPFSPFCLVIHLLFVPAGGVNLSVKMYSDLY